MYNLKTILIYFAIISSFANSKTNKNCEKLRNIFANGVMEFERCTIQNAVPVLFCEKCIDHYVSNLQSFIDLIKTPDNDNHRILCGEHFMDQDALNIVRQQYLHSRQIWDNGRCTNCFVPECDPDKITAGTNVSVICKPSQDVIKMKSFINDFNTCIQQSDANRTDVCTECQSKHNLITDHLKSTESKVCFEIIDMANRTDQIWYGDKKCPRPPVSSTSFVWLFLLLLIPMVGCIFGGFLVIKKYRLQSEYTQHEDDTQDVTTPPSFT